MNIVRARTSSDELMYIVRARTSRQYLGYKGPKTEHAQTTRRERAASRLGGGSSAGWSVGILLIRVERELSGASFWRTGEFQFQYGLVQVPRARTDSQSLDSYKCRLHKSSTCK